MNTLPQQTRLTLGLLTSVVCCMVLAGTCLADEASPKPTVMPTQLQVNTRTDQESALRTGHKLFAQGLEKFAKVKAGAQTLFSNAAATWRALALNAHIHNPHLELNIANASLLAGEPARAIAAFRRAQALDPSDPDVATGLAAARHAAGTESLAPNAATASKANPGDGGVAGTLRGIGTFLASAAERTIRWFPVRLVLAVAALCYVAAFALGIGAALRWRGVLLRHAVGAGIACLLVVGPVIAIEWSEAGIRDAVVVQDGVLARSGPAEMYDPAFKEALRPGVECRIIETRSEWLLIGLWDGRRAWVPALSVELITH
ncbi:MAG: hypothetical protein NTV94_14445 [Planctomycetota bacterium]|nr:hypothetical protein [Planctomycetota bacterium]